MNSGLGQLASIVGQGTWLIEQDPRERAIQSIRLGIDAGLTLIDTAEMYGDGRAEEIVGEAIRGKREQVFVVSKVLPTNASYEGTLRACDRTLKRLRIEALDLYLLHWPSGHPIADTMRALEHLVDEKMTHAIGISNFDVEGVKQAQKALKRVPLACNQVLYHLHERGIERKLIPYCREHGISVMGYSPFGRSSFPKPDSKAGRVLADIATRTGKTVRQVILNFLTRDGVYAIPKSGNPEHVKENAGAIGWRLSPEDIAAIDAAFPAPSNDVPLATA